MILGKRLHCAVADITGLDLKTCRIGPKRKRTLDRVQSSLRARRPKGVSAHEWDTLLENAPTYSQARERRDIATLVYWSALPAGGTRSMVIADHIDVLSARLLSP